MLLFQRCCLVDTVDARDVRNALNIHESVMWTFGLSCNYELDRVEEGHQPSNRPSFVHRDIFVYSRKFTQAHVSN